MIQQEAHQFFPPEDPKVTVWREIHSDDTHNVVEITSLNDSQRVYYCVTCNKTSPKPLE